MLSLISICLIPDALKSKAWKMWEYRVLWRDARRIYSFGNAWGIIRCMTSTYMLIEEIKCSR